MVVFPNTPEPDDMGSVHPFVTPNHHPSNQQVSSHETDVEQRFLALVAQKLAEEGDYTNVPELRQWVEQAHAIATDPTGTLLHPEVVHHMCKQLDIALSDLVDQSFELHRLLSYVPSIILANMNEGLHRKHDLLNDFDSSNLFDYQNPYDILGKNLKECLNKLVRALNFLLSSARKYGMFVEAIRNKDGRQSSSYDHTPENPESQQKEVYALCNDLRYIRRYLLEQVQLDAIANEFQPEDDWQRYSRRLDIYISELPSYAEWLTNLIKQNLRNRLPGNDFTSPDRYDWNSDKCNSDW